MVHDSFSFYLIVREKFDSIEFIKLRPKKGSLVSRNWLDETFFYHSPACIVECVSEYVFLILKNKQTSKKNPPKQNKTKQEYKKKQKTKEEKRIFPKN